MKESVSRPGPHGPQSQPYNGQPGAGTPTRDPVQGETQELAQLPWRCWGRMWDLKVQVDLADQSAPLTCLHRGCSLGFLFMQYRPVLFSRHLALGGAIP